MERPPEIEAKLERLLGLAHDRYAAWQAWRRWTSGEYARATNALYRFTDQFSNGEVPEYHSAEADRLIQAKDRAYNEMCRLEREYTKLDAALQQEAGRLVPCITY